MPKVSFIKSCTAGLGYFFDCAWADTALAAFSFLILIILAELISPFFKTYNRLSATEKREWNLEISKFVLSLVSLGGSFYILFTHNWYLDHPLSQNTIAYPKALDFFLPWMVGYNVGCVLHIVISVLRRDPGVVLPDAFPHSLHIILYATLLESKVLGMLGTFQIVLESHHFIRAPLALLEFMSEKESLVYKILDWLMTLLRPFFLVLSGPYSMAILLYHASIMQRYTWLVWLVIWGQISVNVVFLAAEMWWWGYIIYCWYNKKNPEDMKTYFKDLAKQWETEPSTPEAKKEHRNKGYQFLKHIQSLSDTSDESGLKKRKNKKNKKSKENIKSTDSQDQTKETKALKGAENDDDEYDTVELGHND